MHLTVEAIIENIETVTDFVNEQLDEMGCSHRAQTQIDIALDELFSNICHYAYEDGVGDATIDVEKLPDENAARITLKDQGVPFNPLRRDDPDVSLGIHERSIGGLGIFMVKKIADDMEYERTDGFNVLSFIKAF